MEHRKCEYKFGNYLFVCQMESIRIKLSLDCLGNIWLYGG